MSPRKLLHFLFPIAALTIALMGSSRAEATAISDDQIRSFIARAQAALDEANMRAYQAEHRADSCVAFLKNHHA